jgi:hypothetical protein
MCILVCKCVCVCVCVCSLFVFVCSKLTKCTVFHRGLRRWSICWCLVCKAAVPSRASKPPLVSVWPVHSPTETEREVRTQTDKAREPHAHMGAAASAAGCALCRDHD